MFARVLGEVREPIAVSPGSPLTAFQDFIAIAFRAARKADPAAMYFFFRLPPRSELIQLSPRLYINEYNIESDNPKLRALVGLVTKINEADPGSIDGIGFQSHLSVFSFHFPATGLG